MPCPYHAMGNEKDDVVFPLSSFQALRATTITIPNMDLDGSGGGEGRPNEAGGGERGFLS